jgi:hypothetical protein
MPAGRPKGSTGPTRWTPSRIAQLFKDADTLAGWGGPINKKEVAGEVKKQFPDYRDTTKEPGYRDTTKEPGYRDTTKEPGYRDTTEEQMRQQLSKRYLQRKKIDEVDAFNADVLAYLLGEK